MILFNANSCKEFIIKFMIILCFISNEKYYFISLMEVFLRIVIFEVLLQKWRYWSTETAGFFTRTRKLAKSFSKLGSSFNFFWFKNEITNLQNVFKHLYFVLNKSVVLTSWSSSSKKTFHFSRVCIFIFYIRRIMEGQNYKKKFFGWTKIFFSKHKHLFKI